MSACIWAFIKKLISVSRALCKSCRSLMSAIRYCAHYLICWCKRRRWMELVLERLAESPAYSWDLPDFNKVHLDRPLNRGLRLRKGIVHRAPNFVFLSQDLGVHGDFNLRILEMQRAGPARSLWFFSSLRREHFADVPLLRHRNFPEVLPPPLPSLSRKGRGEISFAVHPRTFVGAESESAVVQTLLWAAREALIIDRSNISLDLWTRNLVYQVGKIAGRILLGTTYEK